MRSPAYYWLQVKTFLFRCWWIFCGAAVIVGLVDCIADMNRTGELQIYLFIGLLGGLFCAVKVNVTK